jgi:alpha-methylacyl-CoA racemase
MESGALSGVRVIDMSALGPGPFCGMILADHGADVIEVLRPAASDDLGPAGSLARGKRSIVVDLRSPRGAEVVARLADSADVLLESNRPGTLERRGLGPDVLLARNPRLVYTRLTGWGQSGPYANRVGHDINYIAGSGMLSTIGTSPDSAPVPPMALLGDFASGSMMAAMGTILALYQRERTGRGQVVDAAMVDGSAMLLTAQLEEFNEGVWAGRGRGVLSGAAPFYGAYRCSDGKWFSVAAIERRFYATFLESLGLDGVPIEAQYDAALWPALRSRIADVFATASRDHWAEVFAEIEACGQPILELSELADDPHLRARGTIVSDDGRLKAAPAPRLSDNRLEIRDPPVRGAHTEAVLLESGFTAGEIAELAASGAIGDVAGAR